MFKEQVLPLRGAMTAFAGVATQEAQVHVAVAALTGRLQRLVNHRTARSRCNMTLVAFDFSVPTFEWVF